jgi:hypothetical protein
MFLSILIGIAAVIVFIVIAVIFDVLISLGLEEESLGILLLIILWWGTPVVFIVGVIISFIKLKGKQI